MAGIDVAVREGVGEDTTALLKAILQASNTGILLTDLEHRSLACNGKFGQFFGVEPAAAVRSGVEELRGKVFPLLKDQEAWVRKLDTIYADPLSVHEDDLVLGYQPELTLHRYTSPVCDESGRLIGRLWTFTDVTQERRRQRMSDVLHFISTLHHADPQQVYRRILRELSSYYSGATAILSILENGYLVFRGIEGAPSQGRELARQMRGNQLENSYCQFLFKSPEGLIVQNAMANPHTCELPVAKLGMSRYMGVVLRDPTGVIVGSLCIIDERTAEPLDEEDLRFVTLLSTRASAELAREAHISERLSVHLSTLERQSAELEQTRGVLAAMNAAFGLLPKVEDTDELIRSQLLLLQGVLGFRAACLLICEVDGHHGYAAIDGELKPVHLGRGCLGSGLISGDPDLERVLESQYSIGVRITTGDREIAVAGFGSETPIDVEDERLRLHLEALFDQIDLLIRVHLLHRELTVAQDGLIRSEKLGVVGALAAATAHDIRNIMSALDIELASSGRDADATLHAVRQQTARFSVLAHRLLSYAKPQPGVRGNIELKDVLDNVVSLLAGHLRISDVSVRLCLPGSCQVRGDAGQLEHVFINLFLNSIQAMPSGGEIAVDVIRDASLLRISVSDNGTGIPNGAELFQPFSTGRANGFGLGLYSCQRIVEEHGGSISVAPNDGEGSTFAITLPNGSRG